MAKQVKTTTVQVTANAVQDIYGNETVTIQSSTLNLRSHWCTWQFYSQEPHRNISRWLCECSLPVGMSLTFGNSGSIFIQLNVFHWNPPKTVHSNWRYPLIPIWRNSETMNVAERYVFSADPLDNSNIARKKNRKVSLM